MVSAYELWWCEAAYAAECRAAIDLRKRDVRLAVEATAAHKDDRLHRVMGIDP
jgi:hypothetical protein